MLWMFYYHFKDNKLRDFYCNTFDQSNIKYTRDLQSSGFCPLALWSPVAGLEGFGNTYEKKTVYVHAHIFSAPGPSDQNSVTIS